MLSFFFGGKEEEQKEKKSRKQKHHPLYGSTISIPSPSTTPGSTPKVSHVHTDAHALIDKLKARRLQENKPLIPPPPPPSKHHHSHSYQLEAQDFENFFHDKTQQPSSFSDNDSLDNVSDAVVHWDKENPPPGHDDDDDEHSKISFFSLKSTASSVRSSLVHALQVAVDESFRLPGKPSATRDASGQAKLWPHSIVNLIKNIVGAGAFGLPRGIAAFGNAPSALWPAYLSVLAMGLIFGYYFLLMGRICRMTGTASYREAWDATMGGDIAALVPLFIILMAGLGNLAYNMILADTCRDLLATIGLPVTRTQSLLGTIVFILLPLCLVKQLSVLAPFSFVGMVGILVTVGVVVLRYYDGTYDPDATNNLLDSVPEHLQPSFGTVGASGAFSAQILILVCMNYQGFFCHYNAPRYYIEMKNNTIARFSTLTWVAFPSCIVLYGILMTYGFLTFGEHSDGFLLNNYSTDDNLITLCRLLIAIALAFTYPLPFIGVRDGILDLLMVPTEKRTSANLNVLTLIMFVVFALLAMQFTDVGLVNAVGGGALGSAVVFIFPALMFKHAVENLGITHPALCTKALRLEAQLSIILMWIGVIMGGVGVYTGLTMPS